MFIIAFSAGQIKALSERVKQSELVIETLEARLELANGKGITVDELFDGCDVITKYKPGIQEDTL